MIHLTRVALLAISLFLTLSVSAQLDDAGRLEGLALEEAPDTLIGWDKGAGIGLDLTHILVINPQAGAGQNRFGIGGAVGLFANYRDNLQTWNNKLSLNLSVEKIGSGVIVDANGNATDIGVPFRKSIDELILTSTYGRKFKANSKWSYAVDFRFRSQLLPSYLGEEDGQIYVSEIGVGPYRNRLVSRFFSPARFALGLGIMYQPCDHLQITFTPATLDVIAILDEDIANLGIHGNKLEEGSTTEYKQTRIAFGANLKAEYQRKFWNDRISFSSTLILFSDYLADPQNVDVSWTNELAFQIVGGLQLTFNNSLFYDDDVLSTISDADSPGGILRDDMGVPVTRPAVNYYQQILLKYVYLF